MASSTRNLLLTGTAIVALLGILLLALSRGPFGLAVTLVILGLVGTGFLLGRPAASKPLRESDDITELSEGRQRELMRGTSLYLREMRYRYSIRIDSLGSSERRCFAAEVNTIRLGFVPAVIIDNTTDRQGYGFVAFVHDGDRWRGPGLPCPADQAEAVQHAARCVSPLATEEETHVTEWA